MSRTSSSTRTSSITSRRTPEQPAGPESVRQTVRQLHGAFGLRFEVQDEIAGRGIEPGFGGAPA
jgi:hypothetical protein